MINGIKQYLDIFSIVDFNKRLKLYAEIGFNDNRMYLADLISQPDHTMATIMHKRLWKQ